MTDTQIDQKKSNKGELAKYLVAGLSATVVYFIVRLAVFAVINAANPTGEINATISAAIANVSATVFAFFTNKYWVFKSDTTGWKNLLKEFGIFCIGRAFVFVEDILISFLFIDKFGIDVIHFFHWLKPLEGIPVISIVVPTTKHGNFMFWTCFNQAFAIVFNYVVSKFIVFKDEK
ncbi:MAG: GtrA family protein [Lactobacillales bacterium]|jgi:putative flippase GtrA|nr:GtrA family protein [Lactobacillales bacterium]